MIRRRTIAAAALAAAAAGSPVAVALAVAAPAHPSTASGGGSGAVLTPATGHRRTAFQLSFVVPETTERTATTTRRDIVSLVTDRRRRCVWQGSLVLPYARAGTTQRVTLTPRRLHGRVWCVGTFVGDVVQEEILGCGPPQTAIMCPALVIRPQVIARFQFRVTRG